MLVKMSKKLPGLKRIKMASLWLGFEFFTFHLIIHGVLSKLCLTFDAPLFFHVTSYLSITAAYISSLVYNDPLSIIFAIVTTRC